MIDEITLQQYQGLIEDEFDIISLLANTSAFINEVYLDINWVGFYLTKKNELVLGPFQGKVACNRIAFDRGVCGHAYRNNETTYVENVHHFPDHIACDAASLSELVIPIHIKQDIIGVLDIDSETESRFTNADIHYFEQIVDILERKLTSL